MATNPAPQAIGTEEREYARLDIRLAAQLFVPAEEATLDCQVINMSIGGASIRCAAPPALDTIVVLYVEGFGRFEGVIGRDEDGLLGMQFVCREAKRQRLAEKLSQYAAGGVGSLTRLRAHERMPSVSSGYFVRPNGDKINCELLDISLQGIALRTLARPPLGEIINLGRSYGRVVRHRDDGIAICFLQVAHSAELPDGH